MARNNTGNPIGSDEFLDFQDNVKNLDVAVNSQELMWPDRFYRGRKTWAGIEFDFEQFLTSAGYIYIGDYEEGLVITTRTQYFVRDGFEYVAGPGLELPYTTTGNWEEEGVLFVSVGDRALRQQLADASDSGVGSDLVGFRQSGEGSVSRTALIKMRERVTFEDFGAVGDGVADDTGAIQRALDSGEVSIHSGQGKTYSFEQISAGIDGMSIVLQAGSTLAAQNPTAQSIIVSGDNVSFFGPGTVKGLPVFDGSNTRPTYGLFWITGDGFTGDGLTIDTVPKEAFMFEDSTYHMIRGCRMIGRYPFDDYNESTTTNHCGIMYNTPPVATHPEPWISIVGNYFEEFIQGALMANYGDASNNTGVNFSGNVFKHCWDHGVYMSRGKGHNITGNSFISCRRPIVSDGVGSVVVGNVLYSDELVQSYGEQSISVRESIGSLIANNVLHGRGAYIFVDCIETTTASDNIIRGNILRSTGAALNSSAIRFGNGAQICENNIVEDNLVNNAFLNPANAIITGTMATGYFGNGNKVRNNTIVRGNPGPIVVMVDHNGVGVNGNSVTCSGSSATPITVDLINVNRSAFPDISDNKFEYSSGGTNVTARGIVVGSNTTVASIKKNTFRMTSPSLSGVTQIIAPSGADLAENQLDVNAVMSGTFNWVSGNGTVTVSNLNVSANSRILLTPLNIAAAAIMRDQGFYVSSAAQSFTVSTANGQATSGSSQWSYKIV